MTDTIFPFLDAEMLEQTELPVLQEVKWDFDKDVAVFKKGEPVYVERAAAVAVWAWNALHTPRMQHEIHTASYGSDMFSLIGQAWSDELKQAEAQQYISECLLVSPYIETVTGFEMNFADSKLDVSFTIVSIYGEISMEVKGVRI